MPLGPQQIERLTARLWPDEDHAAWALLDGAGIPNLLDRLYGEDGPEFGCLYQGELAPDIAEVAPYLARLAPGSPFLDWVLAGWGKHWGVLALAPARLDLAALRRHFRKLNMVYGPTGQPLLFRYYDPRVLPLFAATCDGAQLKELFGPVSSFLAEGAREGETLVLSLANGELVRETLA